MRFYEINVFLSTDTGGTPPTLLTLITLIDTNIQKKIVYI